MDKISDARNEILVACKMYAVSDNMREAVREILQKLVEGVQTQSTNTGSPKLPLFAEVKSAVEKEAHFLLGRTDRELLTIAYIYIERQLRAGA